MGWWKVTDVATGQISCDLPSGHPGKDTDSPVNAVPGRDSPDDYYNGDGPADALGAAMKSIDKQFLEQWGRLPFPPEMRACLNFCFNGWLRRHNAPD